MFSKGSAALLDIPKHTCDPFGYSFLNALLLSSIFFPSSISWNSSAWIRLVQMFVVIIFFVFEQSRLLSVKHCFLLVQCLLELVIDQWTIVYAENCNRTELQVKAQPNSGYCIQP